MKTVEVKRKIRHFPAHEVFLRLYQKYSYHFLLESKQVSLFSGRFSLIGIDPILKISGKNDVFQIEVLHKRGLPFFQKFSSSDFFFADEINFKKNSISGTVKKETSPFEESHRTKMKNSAQVLRMLLNKFAVQGKTLLGLYGALSYDFIRLFENLHDQLPENEINDFTFFLYDTFIYFDHIKEVSTVTCFRKTKEDGEKSCKDIYRLIEQGKYHRSSFSIRDHTFSLSEKEYTDLVKKGKKYITKGEFVQIVFSNILKSKFTGDPFALYLKYREKNPSPYLFYFQCGHEQLVGASPEMMVRCEEKKVHLRPIAGTIKRGKDPIEDHDLMLELLKSSKERAELEMLIDLGRSDLSRICEPGIAIDDYRFVEKYSRVMHTVTHLSGTLRKNYSGFDALISCLNAGTLTGAPKVAAMQTIEKHEKERRGYYGGVFGQLTFSGDVDTTIIIRTAHIKNGELRYQSGAGIVYDSDPKKEYQETLHKAQAFLDCFSL